MQIVIVGTGYVGLSNTVLPKKKKFGFLIVFVPNAINIFVCIASPLHNAIRYELPVVATMPLLIGWTLLLLLQ